MTAAVNHLRAKLISISKDAIDAYLKSDTGKQDAGPKSKTDYTSFNTLQIKCGSIYFELKVTEKV